ncbi:phosphoribosyl transferase domain containing protein [Stylonychia lemnae]|uniref:uracil phosphoribosyltransferase n=1 Tax=Stylonychia lemnae TaxID=5949 RepID=A0A077ZRS7_STYLE|nr:phosphoribosyl transferase domain containing protein [Stylonychia lemnae]|eukprot:CDW72050.1 phosphoribosyl transferase domain containing protein [Stylonychia lemnae]
MVEQSDKILVNQDTESNTQLQQENVQLPANFVTTLNHIASTKYLLSQLRDKNTNTYNFRFFSDRIMRLLVEEAISQEPMIIEKRQSPTGSEYDHYRLKFSPEEYCAVTIIRAGDSMINEVISLLQGITIGKILIQRDEASEDKKPILFYCKFPDNIQDKKRIFILDPMLATGGSVNLCIQKLKDNGVDESNITFINLVSCEDGLRKIHSLYPQVRVITAAIDPILNEHKYIVPGLGDFGDRYFGSRLPN